MLSTTELQRFMTGQTLHAFEPETLKRVASVTYRADGRVTASFDGGDRDQGEWGISDGHYWTRYRTFRDGAKNSFCLEWVGRDTAQAYFMDGTRAFLQSRRPDFRGRA